MSIRRPLVTASLALLLPVLAACGSADATMPAPAAGTQYIVGIDISASRRTAELDEARTLLQQLVDSTTFGDRLVLVETYQAGGAPAKQWDRAAPALKRPPKPNGGERKKLEKFRQTARAVASSFVDAQRSKEVQSTDILATLQRAADYARGGHGRGTTVLLLSDMLNSTRELNMERAGGIPDQRWITDRKAQGRLPDLRGVCIVVAGADVASARGAQAREFWKAYFEAAGTRLHAANYRNMISNASEIGCSAT